MASVKAMHGILTLADMAQRSCFAQHRMPILLLESLFATHATPELQRLQTPARPSQHMQDLQTRCSTICCTHRSYILTIIQYKSGH